MFLVGFDSFVCRFLVVICWVWAVLLFYLGAFCWLLVACGWQFGGGEVSGSWEVGLGLGFWGCLEVLKAFSRQVPGFSAWGVVWRFLSTFQGFQKAWHLCNPWYSCRSSSDRRAQSGELRSLVVGISVAFHR